MWRTVVVIGALAACSDDRVEPVAAPLRPPAVDAKPTPKPPAYDATIPAKPAMFGPWAAIPFGTSYSDIDKIAPWLLDAPHEREGKETTYTVDHKFGGVVASSFVAASFAIEPEPSWGPPIKIQDELGHGIAHELWFDPVAKLRFERHYGRIVVQPYLPLAQYFGHGRFAFEGSRSLLGMPGAEAIEQIKTWAASVHATPDVESDADSIAKSIGRVTHSSVDADHVVVVGPGGKSTPLTAMSTSVDVYVPMTEWSFSPLSYASTQIRLWLDDAGNVHKFWFSTFMPTKHEVDALRARLAATFGSPVTKNDEVRYGTARIVCTPAGERGYFRVTVGACD
jgi:hypothetical protein